jgi:putative oxidoreductase
MSNAMTAFIGRILFAVPMIVFGVFHLMKPSGMAGQVLQGWPAATFLVVLSGIGLILAGIALELLIFVLAIHIPAVAGGGGQQAMIGLLKDISLMGGALLAAGYYGGESSSA